jgi:hypothetical protein
VAGIRNLVPVIKQRRSHWEIPPIDASTWVLEQQREEERIRALCEGTTPQGREILRKMIFRAKKMLEDKVGSEAQIVAVLHGEFEIYEILRDEFLLLLSRIWRVDLESVRKLLLKQLAMLLLIRLKLEQAIRVARNNQ